MNCAELARYAKLNPPVNDEDIEAITALLPPALPAEYRDFLRCTNGLRTEIVYPMIPLAEDRKRLGTFKDELDLFAIQELSERNKTYRVQESLPTFLLIGSVGDAIGIFLDLATLPSPVYRLDLGIMIQDDAVELAASLLLWFASIFDLRYPAELDYPPLIDVHLKRLPKGGAKDFIAIKTVLALPTSMGELYKGVRHLPYRLLHSVPFWRYALICAKYNKSDACLGLSEVDRPEKTVPFPPLG